MLPPLADTSDGTALMRCHVPLNVEDGSGYMTATKNVAEAENASFEHSSLYMLELMMFDATVEPDVPLAETPGPVKLHAFAPLEDHVNVTEPPGSIVCAEPSRLRAMESPTGSTIVETNRSKNILHQRATLPFRAIPS